MNGEGRAGALIVEATRWLGTTEVGGDNRGPYVEIFQKSVSPGDIGQPWCLCFVQYCLQAVDKLAADGGKSLLPVTGGVLDLWRRAPFAQRLASPEPGAIILWRHWKDGIAMGSGHSGIVTSMVDDENVMTVEGNTSPGPGIERNGDGVYEKARRIYKTADVAPPGATMRILGFLRAWG